MGSVTGIGWTDHTFNPWIGCSRVSPACAGCYAADSRTHAIISAREGNLWRRNGPRHITTSTWSDPPRWNREAQTAGVAAKVFAASLADVFEGRADLDEPRERLWALIGATPWLRWQLLTKRPENVAEMVPWGDDWPANVWLGTSAEGQRWADERIPVLETIPAKVLFLSVEPLIELVQLDLTAIDWVILGGMSGRNYKRHELQPEWARSIRDQCAAADTAFFFKQWGGLHSKDGGKVLDGREWCDFPAAA